VGDVGKKDVIIVFITKQIQHYQDVKRKDHDKDVYTLGF